MNLTPNLGDVILAAMDARLQSVWTAIPGRVVDYNANEQSATIQPIVRHAYTDEEGNRIPETLPQIHRVPIVFPGSGQYSITWPVSAGDVVLVVFAAQSIDRWLARGGTDVDPGDDRRHHLSDAIAIPGLRNFAQPIDPSVAGSGALTIATPPGLPPFGALGGGGGSGGSGGLVGEIQLGAGATSAVVVQTALDDWMGALDDAITDVAADPSASAALGALKARLVALNTAHGWLAGTTIAKAT